MPSVFLFPLHLHGWLRFRPWWRYGLLAYRTLSGWLFLGCRSSGTLLFGVGVLAPVLLVLSGTLPEMLQPWVILTTSFGLHHVVRLGLPFTYGLIFADTTPERRGRVSAA